MNGKFKRGIGIVVKELVRDVSFENIESEVESMRCGVSRRF